MAETGFQTGSWPHLLLNTGAASVEAQGSRGPTGF